MGILNFLKKKRQVTGSSVDGLPPLPANVPPTSPEQNITRNTPSQSSDLPDLPAAEPKNLPVDQPAQELDLPKQEEVPEMDMDMDAILSSESTFEPIQSVDSPTQVSSPGIAVATDESTTSPAESETQATEDITQLTGTQQQEVPVESNETEAVTPPQFEVPTNFSDLNTEEIFINKQDYIQLLGNIDLLRTELQDEEHSSENLVDASSLLQDSIKKSLDCEALIAKMEEHISFQGEQ